jgi:hypothetical protein
MGAGARAVAVGKWRTCPLWRQTAELVEQLIASKDKPLSSETPVFNVLVDGRGDYLAPIDWGDARVDDPAYDFAGVPMGVVPAMLEGYGGEPTLAFKARIVRRHLQLALLLMPRGAVSDLSWAERGAPILLELMRFFASGPPRAMPWFRMHAVAFR